MKPQVVASECCAGRCPQNTLNGFTYCLETAVDGIEFDVHLSRDGHVVVQHDYLLNRRITRDREGQWLAEKGPALCDLTLAELQQFDVGRYQPDSHEARSYPDYKPSDGELIPTLDALLTAYRAASGTATLWIELKTTVFDRAISSDPDGLLDAVLSLIERHGLVEQTVLLAFEWQVLLEARRRLPEVGLDFLTINPEFIRSLYRRQGEVNPDDMYLPLQPADHVVSVPATIAAAGGGWWGPYVHDITAEDVRRAQDLGVPVNVWGVDSTAAAIEAALALDADALTISDSTMLQQVLHEREF